MVQGILSGLRPAVIAIIASAGISLLIMAFYGQSTLPNNLTSLDVVALIIFAITAGRSPERMPCTISSQR